MSVLPYCSGGWCGPMWIRVCFWNAGAADAGTFVVSVNNSFDDVGSARVEALDAGASSCLDFMYDPFLFTVREPSVRVDALDEVEEADESNNVLRFPRPSGTQCDIVCWPEDARPQPTPRPAPTVRPSPSCSPQSSCA